MNFIKNICKKAFAFAVKHFSRAVIFSNQMVSPFIARFTGPTVTMPTLGEVGKAIVGLVVAVALANIVNVVAILALTILTMVLGLILPIAIANIIAMVLVVIGLVQFHLAVFDRAALFA